MNLENSGVQEMDAKEVKQVEGGFVVLLACCVVALCLSSCGTYRPLIRSER